MAGAKKNAARRGATIVFVDESGFSERPAVRRTWAPRGQTAVLTHRFRSWNNLSVIGALAYRARSSQHSRVFLMTHPGAVRSPQIVRFLRHLRRHIRGPVVLLWDGLNAHRTVFSIFVCTDVIGLARTDFFIHPQMLHPPSLWIQTRSALPGRAESWPSCGPWPALR